MNHPVLGVWAIESSYEDRPKTDRGTFLFHPDGTVSIAFAEYSAHAVWLASDARSVAITGTRPVGPNEGFVGWFSFQAVANVSDDGARISMNALETRPRPDGTRVEQRAAIEGSRLVVQPR